MDLGRVGGELFIDLVDAALHVVEARVEHLAPLLPHLCTG